MATTNHERVNKALDLLRSGLAAFVRPQVPEGPGATSPSPSGLGPEVAPAPAKQARRFHGTVTLDPARVARDAGTKTRHRPQGGPGAKPPKQNARLLDEPERRALFAFAGASGLG